MISSSFNPGRWLTLCAAAGAWLALCAPGSVKASELPDVDRIGTVEAMARPAPGEGLLTGPSGRDPVAIALDYVDRRGDLFPLGSGGTEGLKLVARATSPDGITHLRFNQKIDGIAAYDHGIEAHVTADGRIVSVTGTTAPDPDLAEPAPDLSAAAGLEAARESTGIDAPAPKRVRTAAGASRRTEFSSGEEAELMWTDTGEGPTLVWRATAEGGDGRLYGVVVDAADGDLLGRQSLSSHLGEARYFERDPLHTPSPVEVTMPPDWIDQNGGGTRLWGQYARTYADPAQEDPAAGDELGGGRIQIESSGGGPASPDWLFDQSNDFPGAASCPSSGCTWDSAIPESAAVNLQQAGTNLHILTSRFHDHLEAAPIGFDESSGNFQRVNTSGRGLGGDYVQAELNDGSGLNNANFETPPDGQAPRMQMYLWDQSNVNGADVADIVYHEYGHGLSNRLVVNASGSSTLQGRQAGMMGEAWSDYYALDLLVNEGSVPDTGSPGEITTGSYVVNNPAGIRAKPIDCPVAPAGLAGCDGHAAGFPEVLGGYTYGDMAVTRNQAPDGSHRPHNGGEIWAETLWQIREALGRNTANALITGGLRLLTDSPSMLDARDAILLQAVATRSAPGAPDDHYRKLWEIFAGRGMGESATTTGTDDVAPVEAYDLPTGVKLGETRIFEGPGGDGDGLVEANEPFEISQDVTALALDGVTGFTGQMFPGDSGVTVVDGMASWPSLFPGETGANSDPLSGRMPDTCLAPAVIGISVDSPGGGASKTIEVDPRPGSDATVPLNDPVPGGPEVASTTVDFVGKGPGATTDVDLRIDDLRHTFLGDLTISLIHAGVEVEITNRFGDEEFDGRDIRGAIFDDEAASLPPIDASPVTGRYRPSGNLAAFDGLPFEGVWTLKISDSYQGDTGELRGWGLDSPEQDCGGPAPEDPGDTAKPRFLGPVQVKLGRKLGKKSKAVRRKATFRYELSEPARVTLRLERRVFGVKRGRRCVAVKRKGRRCSRLVPAGRVTRNSGAGPRRLVFPGKGLRRGRFVAILVARDRAGNVSAPKRVRFRVR